MNTNSCIDVHTMCISVDPFKGYFKLRSNIYNLNNKKCQYLILTFNYGYFDGKTNNNSENADQPSMIWTMKILKNWKKKEEIFINFLIEILKKGPFVQVLQDSPSPVFSQLIQSHSNYNLHFNLYITVIGLMPKILTIKIDNFILIGVRQMFFKSSSIIFIF